MSSKPLLLTPNDFGCEFMRRDGMRVEFRDYRRKGKDYQFLFSGGIWRFADGRVYKNMETPDDIAWRITEQVA